ncbi:MAG: IS66-like element ISH10 family transposase [Chloroflexi bacterium OHK40]
MDEPQRPAELSEEAWQATAPEARQFIALLVAKLAALEARLNQNSQNSSKPPSSDPPSAPPRPVKTPRGKPKSKGAQPGHPDQQRELVPTENASRVVELHPTGCPSCQLPFPELLPTLGPPRRQQVWDLPVIVPELTEYQYFSVCCPCCKGWVTAPRPPDIPPGAFGPRVAAHVALLHGRYRISHRELVALFAELFKLPISLGSVVTLQQAASEALAPAHQEVRQTVAQSEQANVDETTWREGTHKPWLWTAVTAVATLFLLHASRGKKGLSAVLGEGFDGLVTSDRLRTYNSVPVERRQVCWAHVLRSIKGRGEARGPWQAAAADLLAVAEVVMAVWVRFKAGEVERATMQELLRPLQQAMWEQVERGRQQTNTFGALCADLALRWEALWTFVEREGVEPTNNAAERALRPAVLWRKGCFGTQSASGSRFAERMLTVSATCQQHERPLLPYLVEAITAFWAGQPAPRLLPSAVTS